MEIVILINNFLSSAYNNNVEEITITQNGFDGRYMSYLYAKVKQRFSFLPATCDIAKQGDCTKIAFQTEGKYCPYVRKFTEEHIADVLAIGYKYAFFNKRLTLPMLNERRRKIFLTALVAADYEEDRAYVVRRIRGYERYCIDGMFYFRLQELRKRWAEIADYIPTDMGEVATDGFLGFLAEDGEGRIFLKNGKAYDEEYRLLSRSALLGTPSLIEEILLSGTQQIYCFGGVEEGVKDFLKKYYAENVFFC